VELIEKNPITRLSSKVCTTKLLTKIRDNFTEDQQHLFLASFYCFLNHDAKKEFVVSLDDIWKWTGFSRKDPAKRLLEKFFIIDIDYIIYKEKMVDSYMKLDSPPNGGDSKDTIEEKYGYVKETILLTVNAFKKFCLKANTKRADEIHDYYIKLEELLQDTVLEENNEIKKQLEIKDQRISELSRYVVRKFNNKFRPGNCVYFVRSSDIHDSFKIGSTSNINLRLQDFNTASPQEMEVMELFYTEFHCLLEKSIKELFSKFRVSVNNEWYKISEADTIKQYILKQIELYNEFKINSDIRIVDQIHPSCETSEIKVPIHVDEKICMDCNQCKNLKSFFFKDRSKREYLNQCISCYDQEYDNIEHKQCTKCNVIKQKKQGFVIDKTKKDGYAYDCKDCRKENNDQFRLQHQNDNKKQCRVCQEFFTSNMFFKKDDKNNLYDECISCYHQEYGNDKKQCSKCLVIKSRNTDFIRNKSNKDGLSYDCKECLKIKRDKVRNEIREKNKNINKKQCGICQEFLKWNMFFKTGDDSNPYYNQCMNCYSPRSLQCNKCYEIKIPSFFSLDKTKRTGFRTICKTCTLKM